MEREIRIDPVTRIEGHAKITVFLDEDGNVSDARFHVTELRGFEKFCEGRTLWEMPALTARICGICPISHILASAKACDAILAVEIPKTAELLRRLMNLGQIVQSHALSFFYLSAPDLLLGWDADPTGRNVLGLANAEPDLVRAGVRLRAFGQGVIDRLGGKRIHPAWAVPGGVNRGLPAEGRDRILEGLPEAKETIKATLSLFKGAFDTAARRTLGETPTMYMGLVGEAGEWEHYSGYLRIVGPEGEIVLDRHDPARYREVIAEGSEEWTYLKFPFYKPLGYPDGAYRVGPLARVNLCERFGTPLADTELEEFRAGGISGRTLDYHYARLIEILAAIERMERLLSDERILSDDIRAEAGINRREGIGVHEAPRGTLIHRYVVDADGLIEEAEFIVSTGHNNLAMNATVREIARSYIRGGKVTEGILNRIEGGIRAYDPCLSCSVHAIGQMPLRLDVVGPDGDLVRRIVRDGR